MLLLYCMEMIQMNDVTKVLCERRSIRKFKQDQIPDDILNEILKCGTFAPSGKNMQSAKIVVVQNKELISLSLIKFIVLFRTSTLNEIRYGSHSFLYLHKMAFKRSLLQIFAGS